MVRHASVVRPFDHRPALAKVDTCGCRRRGGADAPSPTLSPTDPVPRGLLTLCPGLHEYIYIYIYISDMRPLAVGVRERRRERGSA